MLCSRFVRSPAQVRHGRTYAFTQRGFDGMLHTYERSLQWVLRHRLGTLVVSLVVLAATVHLFRVIPKGFFPSEDTGQIFTVTEAGQDISFEGMRAHQLALMRLLDSETNILANFTSSVGAGGPTATLNAGRMFLRLKPRSTGRPHVDQVIQRLRVKLNSVPGISAFLQNPPLIRIGGTFSKSLYQFTLQGPDLQELYSWVPIVQTNMAALPGLQDVTSDLQISSPQMLVQIDRDKARAVGVTAAQIESALANAYGSRQVSTIYAPINQYWVILEVLPEHRQDPAALGQLYIRASTGRLVPLQAVARITRGVGPLTVNHFGQLPAVTLSFNLAPGVSLGTAIDEVQRMLATLRVPATLTANFQGQAQVFQSSLKGLGILLLMSILVIYLILGILYESFIHPITILSGLPAAGFGALLTLLLFQIDLNLYGFVGLILLVGIVKKNAIMMIDFALDAQHHGKSPRDAIYQGCLRRFRPIMMTTMAALMGTLPIAFGYGAGGEARQPLGLAVVGGLMVSQLLTLFITPVVYLYLESFQQWARVHLRRARAEDAPAIAGERA
jgi:HAE1 family hydrophobic/amphiphilic exporter-1